MDGPAPILHPDDPGFVLDLAAHAAGVDRDGTFPWASLAALHNAGLLALTARPEDGGAGAGLAQAAKAVRHAGRGCASTALILAMQLIHLRAAAHGDWPERLRADVGRGAVRSGTLTNALRVEPALGTPARGGLPATVARRTAEGWRLSGLKIYSTGAPGLTWMLVFARTDEDPPRTGLFLVPAQSPGIAIEDTWDQLGLRGSGSHDVVFTDVLVPHDHALDLRPPAAWAQPDPAGVAWNTLMVAALYTGMAEAARDWVVSFLRGRAPANLGAPLATLPWVQEAVGRIEAVRATVQLAGNHGLSRANPLERHLRDVLCARVHTPQPDAAFVAAGRAALGQ